MSRNSFLSRLYPWLLRLYPAEFRKRYGSEMHLVFEDRARDASRRRLATLGLLSSELRDIFTTALKEHVSACAQIRRRASGHDQEGRNNMIDGLLQDFRYAIRTLVKSPAFVGVAVLSLALGIGANTAIFSIVNGVLFKPMPVHNPDELVAVYATTPRLNVPSQFSYPDYLDYREQNDVFTDIFAHFGVPLSLAERDQPEMVWGEIVTGNYFTGLGAEPVVGRTLIPEDDTTPGAHPVAVLRHGYWERRFGADPSVVGRTIKLNGHEFTLVGVAPKGFTGTKFLGYTPDLWVPLMMHAQVWPESEGLLDMRDANWLQFRARLLAR